MLVVAAMLGHCQRRMPDAEPGARRLVHLAEDRHHVRQYAGFFHRVVKVLDRPLRFALVDFLEIANQSLTEPLAQEPIQIIYTLLFRAPLGRPSPRACRERR